MRPPRNSKKFLDAVIQNRNKSKELDKIFKNYENAARGITRPRVIKGVHDGKFFRIKVPPRQTVPELPKLPNPAGPAPKPLQSLPPKAESATVSTATGATATQQKQQQARDMFDRMLEFLKLNGPVLIMNFGSLCTLLAFTRTDVLELRCLSVSGSVCFIVYQLSMAPVKWLTIAWTSLFAGVNTWKIVEIVHERHSHVEMTDEQAKCFQTYFASYGITPKQFEAITKSAQRIVVKKNEPLIKQGQRLEHVYLVVEGSTRASILGRYLTAASSTPLEDDDDDHKAGGTSGAWVGEMAFLEACWDKDTGKASSKQQQQQQDTTKPRAVNAMYTVVANEDCLVWRWTHADMERLMKKSGDMRDALTRAMTSAIVGKVINFTVSRSSARPTWQTWLDDWKAKRSESHPQDHDDHPPPHHDSRDDKDHGDHHHHHHSNNPGPATTKDTGSSKVGRESPA